MESKEEKSTRMHNLHGRKPMSVEMKKILTSGILCAYNNSEITGEQYIRAWDFLASIKTEE